MSASVDQRPKGQSNRVQNGPITQKETVTDEDFDAYLQNNQTSQAYTAGPTNMAPHSDPYMPSYYSSMPFPYLNTGGESTWSTGDNFNFYGGYGPGESGNYLPESSNFYSQPGTTPPYLNQSGFNFFPGNADFSAWGSPSQPQGQGSQRNAAQSSYYNDYSRYSGTTMGTSQRYQDVNGMDSGDSKASGMKTVVEQGISGLSIGSDSRSGVSAGSVGSAGDGKVDSEVAKSPSQTAQTVTTTSSAVSAAPAPAIVASKPVSWASIASKPAKPQPKLKPKSATHAPVPAQLPPMKHTMDIGTWNGGAKSAPKPIAGLQQAPLLQQHLQAQPQQRWAQQRGRGEVSYANPPPSSNAGLAPISAPVAAANSTPSLPHPVLEKLRSANEYNPSNFNLNPKGARLFIIKSYSEDDIHRSIKYSIWCSTEHGNKRLDSAFRERQGKGPVYLYYSVNGSGHFCGMAQMMSEVDYQTTTGVWAQDKWKGKFEVKWIYVKDVPNSQLRHIRLENNENKPVTNSRDTQEVPVEKGKQVLKIMHNYRHTTSIFDDFGHYEKRQEEDHSRRPTSGSGSGTTSSGKKTNDRN